MEQSEDSNISLFDRTEYQKISAELGKGIESYDKPINLNLDDWETDHLLMQEAFDLIESMLREYLDLKEEYYPFLATWILGTYFHKDMITYPYVFLNAMKGSGKSRTLGLMMALSNNGEVQNSMTEAVLFRENKALGIDEFEGIGKKGTDNLRELLNSGYKRGAKVYRMKKVKSAESEEQVAVAFPVFRPIALANISGMEDVLGDRCISLILEKSSDQMIANLLEIWNLDSRTQKLKKIMSYLTQKQEMKGCSVVLCSVDALKNVYLSWNKFQKTTLIYTTTFSTLNYTSLHYDLKEIFEKIKSSQITGRPFELFFPLFLIAAELPDQKVFDKIVSFAESYTQQKKDEEFIENQDVLLYQFVAGRIEQWERVADLREQFQKEMQINEVWLTNNWMGQALKRLNLRKQHKRMSSGVYVVLDINKAAQKVAMFKSKEDSA